MTRTVLTDVQWAIIEPFCLGKTTDAGQTGRPLGETMFCLPGNKWRELPIEFGKWDSVFKRFRTLR